MITLLLDTSKDYLRIGIVKEGVMIENYQELAQQKQSEITIPLLATLFDKHHLSPKMITEIVITSGPGSYTGLRIAMTIAKVIGSLANVSVYTMDTLHAMALNGDQRCVALMDARSKRAYVFISNHGQIELNTTILSIDQIKELMRDTDVVVGDAQLVGYPEVKIDFLDQMLQRRACWNKVESIDDLAPNYFKDTNQYGN